MSATTWFIIAIVGFSLAGIALAVSIALFIKLNIPAVIGDLSGKTLAREIKAMRDVNTASGDKSHRSSRVNIDRGKLTEKVNDLPGNADESSIAKAKAHSDKRLDKTDDGLNDSYDTSTSKRTASLTEDVSEVADERMTDVLVEGGATAVLTETKQTEVLSETKQTEVLSETKQTEVLSETRQTEVLSENKGTEILSEARQTEVLTMEDEYTQSFTTVLNEVEVEEPISAPVVFKVTRSIVEIHTDEVV